MTARHALSNITTPTKVVRCLAIALASTALWLLLFGATANAANMPNENDFQTNASGQPKNMRILVGDSGTITVEDSYIKIYSTSRSPRITFQNISGCATNPSTIRVYRTLSNQTVNGVIASTALGPTNCPGSFAWDLPQANTNDLANVGSSNYYVWIIQASSTSGLTYFDLSSSDANFGYVGRLAPGGLGSDRFAIQNSYPCTSVGSFSPWANCITYKARSSVDYTIKFATHCDNTSNKAETLRWYDDDQNSPETNPSDAQVSSVDMRFDIRDETDGTWVVQDHRPQNGNDQQGSYSMVFKPGHKYRWVWKNVADSNALQFQLPYDSFFYNVDCDAVPKVVLDPTCGATLKFRVSDTDGDKYNVRLRWDLQDTSSTMNNLNPGNNPGENVYEFDISSYRDFGSHFVSLRVVSETGTVVEDTPVAGVGPCAEIQCVGNPTLSSSDPSPGEAITVTQVLNANIGSRGTKGTLYNARIVSTGPPTITTISGSPGDFIPTSPQTVVGPTSGGNTTGPIIGGGIGPEAPGPSNTETIKWTMTYPAAGQYTGWVAVTGGSTVNCPFDTNGIPVSAKPYLRAWRGDVVAGCEGTTGWPKRSGLTTNGRITTSSLGGGKGAGTDMIAQALDRIDGFTSGQKTGRTVEDYMTLANTTSVGPAPNATWGGRFGKGQCASDYYAGAPTPSSSNGNKGALPSKLDSLTSGDYIYSGGTLGSAGASSITAGQHITVYVDGDLTITNDILLGGSTSWAGATSIPSLKVVVNGDIYIDHAVSKIEGIFIAQPKKGAPDTGGTIITCSDGHGRFNAGTNKDDKKALIDNCADTTTSTSLSVYGALVARRLELLRLKWSIGTASPGDNLNASGVPAGTAAEKFIYSPETWLFAGSPTANAGTYDSITSLPPVF